MAEKSPTFSSWPDGCLSASAILPISSFPISTPRPSAPSLAKPPPPHASYHTSDSSLSRLSTIVRILSIILEFPPFSTPFLFSHPPAILPCTFPLCYLARWASYRPPQPFATPSLPFPLPPDTSHSFFPLYQVTSSTPHFHSFPVTRGGRGTWGHAGALVLLDSLPGGSGVPPAPRPAPPSPSSPRVDVLPGTPLPLYARRCRIALPLPTPVQPGAPACPTLQKYAARPDPRVCLCSKPGRYVISSPFINCDLRYARATEGHCGRGAAAIFERNFQRAREILASQ